MAEQQQKKFSLERAVAGKRAAVETPEKTARKIPKVSQMQPTEPRPQRVTTNAAVVICVYPVTDSAGDLWAVRGYRREAVANSVGPRRTAKR